MEQLRVAVAEDNQANFGVPSPRMKHFSIPLYSLKMTSLALRERVDRNVKKR